MIYLLRNLIVEQNDPLAKKYSKILLDLEKYTGKTKKKKRASQKEINLNGVRLTYFIVIQAFPLVLYGFVGYNFQVVKLVG